MRTVGGELENERALVNGSMGHGVVRCATARAMVVRRRERAGRAREGVSVRNFRREGSEEMKKRRSNTREKRARKREGMDDERSGRGRKEDCGVVLVTVLVGGWVSEKRQSARATR